MSDETDHDPFDMLVAGLEEELEPDYSALDYRRMSTLHLLNMKEEIKLDLAERGALLHPKTDEDKGRQTKYYGITLELQRRSKEGGDV